jgi:hypothetical protein
MWNLDCGNGHAFAVMVYNDPGGSTKVLACDQLTLVTGGSGCFRKY